MGRISKASLQEIEVSSSDSASFPTHRYHARKTVHLDLGEKPRAHLRLEMQNFMQPREGLSVAGRSRAGSLIARSLRDPAIGSRFSSNVLKISIICYLQMQNTGRCKQGCKEPSSLVCHKHSKDYKISLWEAGSEDHWLLTEIQDF